MEKSSLESKLKSTNQGGVQKVLIHLSRSPKKNFFKHISTGAQFGVEQKFLSLYSSLTVEERFHIGHAKEDLVVSNNNRNVFWMFSCQVFNKKIDFWMINWQVKSCTFRGFDCMGMDEDSFDHEVSFWLPSLYHQLNALNIHSIRLYSIQCMEIATTSTWLIQALVMRFSCCCFFPILH